MQEVCIWNVLIFILLSQGALDTKVSKGDQELPS